VAQSNGKNAFWLATFYVDLTPVGIYRILTSLSLANNACRSSGFFKPSAGHLKNVYYIK